MPSEVGAVPPPVFVLADFDPDGIAIMSTYKHGSWNMSHENAQLNVPGIRWLGLRSRDLFTGTDTYEPEKPGRLPLSNRDRNMARKMLEKPAMRESGEGEWRREVQVMMMMGFKAEMEMMDGREGGIAKWTENRLMDELARL